MKQTRARGTAFSPKCVVLLIIVSSMALVEHAKSSSSSSSYVPSPSSGLIGTGGVCTYELWIRGAKGEDQRESEGEKR